jgi:hypothetical protein
VYFAGAENSNDEVEAGLDKLRDLTLRYGLSVVIFHHVGKATDVREPEDLWRGASRLADWASTRVTMMPHYTAKQAEEQNMGRQDARRFVDVRFLRRGEPTPDFSMVIDHRTGWWGQWTPPGRPTPANSVKASWEVAAECAKSGGWASARKAAAALGCSVSTAGPRLDKAVLDGWLDESEGARGATRYTPSEQFLTEPEPGAGPLVDRAIRPRDEDRATNPPEQSDDTFEEVF